MVLKTVRKTGFVLTLAFALLGLAVMTAPVDAASTEDDAKIFTIDPVHSSAVFKAKHFDVSNFYGVFGDVSGTVTWDAKSPANSSIDVKIAADSVDSRNGQRDEHIESPDFLNAKQFPNITFKSSSVKPLGDDKFEVAGELTLHGVTKKITVEAMMTGAGEHPRSGNELVGFETRFTVDRTNYDMDFMVGPLSSEIDFILAIEAGTE